MLSEIFETFDDTTSIVGFGAIALVSIIVVIDTFRYFMMEREVPRLGALSNGGWAWSTTIRYEYERNWANVITLIVMGLMPLLLDPILDIPPLQLFLFPLALFGMLLLQILPKRYAVTRDILSADGFTFEWDRVVWRGWEGGRRIVLQRTGWWLFAPLPLGGSPDDLEQAALRIEAAVTNRWEEIIELLQEEE